MKNKVAATVHTEDNSYLTSYLNIVTGKSDFIKEDETIEIKKEMLETIIDNLSDAIFIYNKGGKVVMLNEEARKLVYPTDSLKILGDSYSTTKYFYEDGNEIPLEKTPTYRGIKGELVRNQRIIVKQSSREFILEFNTTPVYDKKGNITHIVTCTHDITESIKNYNITKDQNEKLLNSEQEKIEALIKASEMKDEFISSISHEFKTPLTVINSAIQAMELICKNELSDKAKGFLNKIRQNSNRQLKLVNNLLDITRINAGHLKINKTNMEIVLLTRSITESIIIYAEQKNIKLTFSSTLEKKVVGIDEEKYERILLNLLSNAIKFTPKNKSISVKVSQMIVDGKCKVCIKVRDKGVGIPQDKMELIFERFGQVDSSLTRQAEGTGIGLCLVKMLVELLDGEIILESKEGIGSTFTILLPIARVEEAPQDKMVQVISDNRLILATAIEFSDVYLK